MKVRKTVKKITSACPESGLCLADAELNLPGDVRWGLGGATQKQFATSVSCNKEIRMSGHILYQHQHQYITIQYMIQARKL